MLDLFLWVVQVTGAIIAVLGVTMLWLFFAYILFDTFRKMIKELYQIHLDKELFNKIEEYRNDFA